MKACHRSTAVVLGLAWAALATTAQGLTLAPGFDTFKLAANDDQSTGPIPLGFNWNFYGQNYSSAFVNNNGNITFGVASHMFTPTGLGANYAGVPIIAPFFADVDTRGPGSGVVTYGIGTYQGFEAFGVTYPMVGYYDDGSDKLNSFQVILTNRGDVGPGDFDIFFNYQQVQWEAGDASGAHDGLGGTSAAVGFSNGSGQPGTYYELPGSLVNGAFLDDGPNALIANTNNGVAGQYQFKVRNGLVIVPTVPLPQSAPLFGGALLILSVLTCRRKRRTTSRL